MTLFFAHIDHYSSFCAAETDCPFVCTESKGQQNKRPKRLFCLAPDALRSRAINRQVIVLWEAADMDKLSAVFRWWRLQHSLIRRHFPLPLRLIPFAMFWKALVKRERMTESTAVNVPHVARRDSARVFMAIWLFSRGSWQLLPTMQLYLCVLLRAQTATLHRLFQHQLSVRLCVAVCQIQPLREYIMFNSQLKLNNHPSLFSKDTLCLLTIGHFCVFRLREQSRQKTCEQMMYWITVCVRACVCVSI